MFGPNNDGNIVVYEFLILPFGFAWLKWQIFDFVDNDTNYTKVFWKLYKKN